MKILELTEEQARLLIDSVDIHALHCFAEAKRLDIKKDRWNRDRNRNLSEKLEELWRYLQEKLDV